MAYVQGKYCRQCNLFVIHGTSHVCSLSISTKTSLSDTLSEDESQNSVNPCSIVNKSSLNTDFKLTKTEGVSKDDMYKLIQYVETCSPIWNHKMCLSERSDTVKMNLWNQIFVNFGGKYSIDGLQKSWKYLKEKYTRENKLEPSGSAGGKKQEWPHLKSLRFLDEVLIVNKNVTENIPTVSAVNRSDVESVTPVQKRSKKSSIIESHLGTLIEELQQNRPSLLPANIFSEPEPLSEDQRFSAYLACIMTDLPKLKKIKLQGKIIDMVIKELEI